MRATALALLSILASLPALALLPSRAFGGVDVPLRAKARVRSTHAPSDEVEIFRFDGTTGAKLKVVVVGKRRSDLDFSVSLVGPGETPIDLSTSPRFRDTGKRVLAAGLVLTASGPYRLEIGGGGTGDYTLTLQVTPRKRFGDTFELAPAASDDLDLAAPMGSRLACRATAPRGSAATPRFGTFDGGDLSGEGRRTAKLHSVTLPSISTGGDLALPVSNAGTEQGSVKVSVVVRPPRGRDRLDFRSKKLGQDPGGETAVGKSVGAGGGVVGVVDAESDIDGAGVDVPAGALPIPTRITVTSAADIPPGDDTQPGGPAVEFGPEGLEFIEDATIVLPLDVSQLPLGTQPADIRVLKVDAMGNKTFIDPDDDDVDLVGGTVSVAISSFSVYQPNVPGGGIPNLEGRDFWTVSMKLAVVEDSREDADSREREISIDAGTTSFVGPQTVTGGVISEVEERRVTLSHDDEGDATLQATTMSFTDATLSWRLSLGGRTVSINAPKGSSSRVQMGRDGSMLLEELETDPGVNEVFMALALQKRRRPPPASDLVGGYWLGGFTLGLDGGGQGNGPARMDLSRAFGTLTLRANGTFTATLDEFRRSFDGGGFVTERDRGTTTGRWSIDLEEGPFFGSVIVSPSGPESDAVRFLPHATGNALIGVEKVPSTAPQVLLLVRRSTNFRVDRLAEEYESARFRAKAPFTYTVPGSEVPVSVPDFAVQGGAQILRFAGDGTVELRGSVDLQLVRDPNAGPAGVRREFSGPQSDLPTPIQFTRSGRFSVVGNNSVVGAVTPDALFGFAMDDPTGTETEFGLTLLIDPAPEGFGDVE